MTTTYFKRFRMQIDLNVIGEAPGNQIEQYKFISWQPNLVGKHAVAKFASFCDELDSHVFPCLGNADSCLKLMNEISCRKGFVPEATWLLVFQDSTVGSVENCGTVQGIQEKPGVGSIQNLGIAPQHRGSGLGTELLMHSLAGFKSIGVGSVTLEVTAQNEAAVKLYQRVGFEVTKLVYKYAELDY